MIEPTPALRADAPELFERLEKIVETLTCINFDLQDAQGAALEAVPLLQKHGWVGPWESGGK